MDIDTMREVFGENEEYNNALISSEPLDLETERVFSLSSRADIRREIYSFTHNSSPQ
jgi:putative ABC transport system permease protein